MSRRKTMLVAAAVSVVVAGGIVAATLPASTASSGCSVAYSVQNQWSGGFVANVTITNLGSAVSTWSLTYDFPDASQKVTNGWNATWSQSGQHVTAANMSWNGSLATNGTAAIGFQGTFGSANPAPTSFALNGTVCNGVVGSPSPSVSA